MKRFDHRRLLIVVLIAAAASLFFTPYLWIALLIINLLISITLNVHRISFSTIDTDNFKEDIGVAIHIYTKKISIHIPICNEPSEIVIQTLKSVLEQSYRNFEVIVLSNNTDDASIWTPVQRFCKQHNEKLKFYNYPNVNGYKAGALNICLDLMDQEADYIMTIDADYQLYPNSLKFAISQIQIKGLDVLQFPQYYRNTSKNNEGLTHDFHRYFSLYSKKSGIFNCTLPTGTLSLIKKEALKTCKGWKTESITEDALLGKELLERKLKSSYDSTIIGHGLMPETLDDLTKQRSRWIFGNIQVLSKVLRSYRLKPFQKWLASIQLLAWINLLGFPLITLLLYLIRDFLPVSLHIHQKATHLAITTIVTHFIFHFLLIVLNSGSFVKNIKEYLIHFALCDLSAFKWWEFLFISDKPFKRTNKFKTVINFNYRYYLLPILLLIGLFMANNSGNTYYLILAITIALFIGKSYLHLELFLTRKWDTIKSFFVSKTKILTLKNQL